MISKNLLRPRSPFFLIAQTIPEIEIKLLVFQITEEQKTGKRRKIYAKHEVIICMFHPYSDEPKSLLSIPYPLRAGKSLVIENAKKNQSTAYLLILPKYYRLYHESSNT
jgi:hypothetical protein